MFKNSSPQTEDGTSLIGEGLNIEGDLVCRGSIEVAGIMNGSVKAANLKILETGSVIGGIKADKFEVFGFIEGEIYADDIKIGKTAMIKGDIYFKDNLKIDEGADVDGYIKRVKQNNQSSTSQSKKDTKKPAEKKQDQQIDIEENEKKAVNQN